MLQAMFNGVSAIEANQTDMDVIGNNIANVNTTAYKSGRVTFEDQLSQTMQGASSGNGVVGGTNPIQVGLGVRVGAIDTIMAQGGLQSSTSPTDMAIQGNGYFMLGNGTGINYTRDGSFSIDNSGNLVNANGAYVLGWAADQNGSIDASKEITTASHLTVPVGGLEATAATTKASFGGNLSSDTVPGAASYTRSIKVYDSLGKAQTVSLSFTRDTPPAAATSTAATGGTLAAGTYSVGYSYVNAAGETQMSPVQTVAVDGVTTNAITVDAGTLPAGATNIKVYIGTNMNSLGLAGASAGGSGSLTVNTLPPAGSATPRASSWSWSATIPDSTSMTNPPATLPAGLGQVFFDSNGKVITSADTGAIQFNNSDSAATPQTIAPDFSGASQISGASSVAATSQNGYAPGTLQSFTIDQSGTINGIFTNGYTRTLGQIAMTSFANPQGLERNGTNDFTATANSGLPQIGAATTGSFGQISTGYLEQSNVDLSNEFTNMIITQRGFQANTKVVSTVDQMLNTLIDMKQ